MTSLSFASLSMSSIRSAPLVSSNLKTWPERERIKRQLFFSLLPSSAGGGSGLLQRAPSTEGRRGSPLSKTNKSSSSTSGRKKGARFLPALGEQIFDPVFSQSP